MSSLNILSARLALYGITAVGLGVLGASTGGLAGLGLAAAAAGNSLLVNLTPDLLHRWWQKWKDTPANATSADDTLLCALRQAQLQALGQKITIWHDARKNRSDQAEENFHFQATRIIAEQRRDESIKDWAKTVRTAPDSATLPHATTGNISFRHGFSPFDSPWREPAEQAMLAEFDQAIQAWQQEKTGIPPSFRAEFSGDAGGNDGWFSLFVRAVSSHLRSNPAFATIWTVEQAALLQDLLTDQGDRIDALSKNITTGIGDLGTALDALAGVTTASSRLMDRIVSAIDNETSWLRFERSGDFTSWRRFSPRNPAIPFVGRTVELTRLWAFLRDDAPFRWWMITGPGGMGKTRLARQLCQQAATAGWTVGFLRKGQVPAPGWAPSRPTLIIADYASENGPKVRELAGTFLHHTDQNAPVIRLLLVDRQESDAFRQEFLRDDEEALIERCFAPAPFPVPAPSRDQLWTMVQSRPWTDDHQPLQLTPADFFDRLTRLDRAERPLVAMILADQPDLSGDLDQVLRKFLHRYRNHFRPSTHMQDDSDAVIAIATMLGKTTETLLIEFAIKLKREITGRELSACAQAIGSPPPRGRELDGIQPDLIGEFFALETLAGHPNDPQPPPLAWIAQTAWQHHPGAMAAFALRAIQNFPRHPAIFLLTNPTLPDQKTAAFFADFLWSVSATSPIPLPWPHFSRLCDHFHPMTASWGHTPIIRTALASAMFNTLNHAKAENDLKRCDQLLDQLQRLTTDWPDDVAVRERLAKAVVNTLNHAKAENDLDRRDQLLDQLQRLATDWPNDAAMREALAKALFNTLNHAKAENDLDRRDQLLDQLQRLATDWPDHAAVREQLAKAVVNTLVYAKAENDLDRRDQLLDQLQRLATDWPDDAAVREALAKAVVNTQIDAKAENDLDRRDQLLDQLQRLATDWPNDAAVREALARAVINTLNHAKAENDLDRRDRLLDQLQRLATDWPDDAAVREQLASALFNTQIDAKAENDLDRRDQLLNQLQRLATDWPDDAAVQAMLARFAGE